MTHPENPFGVTATLTTDSGSASFVSLAKLATKTGAEVARLPHTVKILLENIARRAEAAMSRTPMLWRWPNGPTVPTRPSHLCPGEF